MGGRVLCGALVALLLAAWVTDAEARGRRRGGFGGGSYHGGDIAPAPGGSARGGGGGGGGSSGSYGAGSPAACTPQSPCSTSGGSRYVTDPATGVSRFLPK